MLRLQSLSSPVFPHVFMPFWTGVVTSIVRLFEPGANAKTALTAAILTAVGVLRRILMPLGTVSLLGMLRGRSNATQNINSIGHRLQMERVGATAVTTEVVQSQPFRNGAKGQFVSQTVGQVLVPATWTKLSIAVWHYVAQPCPALAGIMRAVNLRPEMFNTAKA